MHYQLNSKFCVSLEQLFQGSPPSWVESLQRRALGSLQDEMEIYKMLDSDAPGDSFDAFKAGNGLENSVTI